MPINSIEPDEQLDLFACQEVKVHLVTRQLELVGPPTGPCAAPCCRRNLAGRAWTEPFSKTSGSVHCVGRFWNRRSAARHRSGPSYASNSRPSRRLLVFRQGFRLTALSAQAAASALGGGVQSILFPVDHAKDFPDVAAFSRRHPLPDPCCTVCGRPRCSVGIASTTAWRRHCRPGAGDQGQIRRHPC